MCPSGSRLVSVAASLVQRESGLSRRVSWQVAWGQNRGLVVQLCVRLYSLWDSLMVRARDPSIEKLRVRFPGGATGEFSSPKLTLCADSNSVSIPPPPHPTTIRMLPQRRVKDPGHSARYAGGRLHLNTHTPLTQRSRSVQTMPTVQA